MDKAEIEARVKKVIAEVLEIDEPSITPQANLVFDLGADSTESLELVAAFEEEFDIEMEMDKALSIQTVSEAVDFIKQYLD